jgi:hypothetical protein
VRHPDPRIELLARDAREDHAVAPGESQLAFVIAIALHQLRIALQCIDDLNRAVARLLKRAHHHLGLAAAAVENFEIFARGLANGFQMPILGFQNQRTPARMDHHKIGSRLFGANWHIPPQQIIVFEFLLQTLCQPFFTAGHTPRATAERGN